MKFNQIIDLEFALWKSFLGKPNNDVAPLLLLGSPGIGKTSAGRTLADRMTAFVQSHNPEASPALFDAFDLTSIDAVDLGGLPLPEDTEMTGKDPVTGKTSTETIKVTRFAVMARLAPFVRPGAYGVLVLDDITQASPAVQVAARQLVLDKKVGDYKISPHVRILITGNRRDDKSGASTLPAHFRNCTNIQTVDVNVDDWCTWYLQQDGYAPEVASFCTWRKLKFLSQLPKDADEAGAFPTPRSWAKLGCVLPAATEAGLRDDVIRGHVGKPVGSEFIAYLNLRMKLVDPAKVLLNPKQALPDPRKTLDTADKKFSMISSLAELAVEWRKDQSDPDRHKAAPTLLLLALVHVVDLNNEYIMPALHLFARGMGDGQANASGYSHLLDGLPAAKAKDPRVGEVFKKLSKAWSGS